MKHKLNLLHMTGFILTQLLNSSWYLVKILRYLQSYNVRCSIFFPHSSSGGSSCSCTSSGSNTEGTEESDEDQVGPLGGGFRGEVIGMRSSFDTSQEGDVDKA